MWAWSEHPVYVRSKFPPCQAVIFVPFSNSTLRMKADFHPDRFGLTAVMTLQTSLQCRESCEKIRLALISKVPLGLAANLTYSAWIFDDSASHILCMEIDLNYWRFAERHGTETDIYNLSALAGRHYLFYWSARCKAQKIIWAVRHGDSLPCFWDLGLSWASLCAICPANFGENSPFSPQSSKSVWPLQCPHRWAYRLIRIMFCSVSQSRVCAIWHRAQASDTRNRSPLPLGTEGGKKTTLREQNQYGYFPLSHITAI